LRRFCRSVQTSPKQGACQALGHETELQLKEGALAPRWHTATLVALMLAVAITGTLLQRHGSPPVSVAPAVGSRFLSQYLPILSVNWGLLLYVSRLFRTRNALPDLLEAHWQSWARAAVDLTLALGACLVILLLQVLYTRHFGVGRSAAVSALLPSTGAERLSWVLVAVSVGFCEEVVFRGYLQTQLAAFTGSASVGIALQAALFGIAHAEQGWNMAPCIAGYGVIFGVLARVRRSLWPGIASHIAIDLLSGFWR
jgi:membrane protease YdiL (CAAX protease family)